MTMAEETETRNAPFRPRFAGRLSGARLGWRIGASVAIPAVFLLSWLGWTPFPPCLFRELTGLSCPTCGMTRAFQSAAHGDFLSALGLNPAGAMVFYLLPLLFLKLSLESFTRTILRIGIPGPLFRVAMALFIGLWLGFGAARMLLELSGNA